MDVEGFDPIEQTIARGIVKGMVEDGMNPVKAGQVGSCVAEAVGAYRRTMDLMAAPAARKPGPFDKIPDVMVARPMTANEIREEEAKPKPPKPRPESA